MMVGGRLWPTSADLRGAQSRQLSEVLGTSQSNGRHSPFLTDSDIRPDTQLQVSKNTTREVPFGCRIANDLRP